MFNKLNHSTKPENIQNIRACSFCNLSAPYDDLPDGTVCWLGICACAECLKKEVTKEFREELKHYVS